MDIFWIASACASQRRLKNKLDCFGLRLAKTDDDDDVYSSLRACEAIQKRRSFSSVIVVRHRHPSSSSVVVICHRLYEPAKQSRIVVIIIVIVIQKSVQMSREPLTFWKAVIVFAVAPASLRACEAIQSIWNSIPRYPRPFEYFTNYSLSWSLLL